MRKPRPASSREHPSWPGTMRTFARYTQLGWTLVAAVLLGLLVGRWADARLGTTPWLLLVGVVGGIGIGLYTFLKATLRKD